MGGISRERHTQGGAPMPLKLSDAELDAMMQAARPLPIDMREPFLLAVAHALSDRDVVGPGVVHQVCRELQRRFMTSPPQVPRNQSR